MSAKRLATRRRASALAAGAASLALASCTDEPVQLGANYEPSSTANEHALPAGHARCRISLAGVQDLRDDPQAAGVLDARFLHAQDAPAWVRSGILSLSRDGRLDISDGMPDQPAQLTIRVDVLKVYIMEINEAKSANVAIRVHYTTPNGPAGDQLFRGTYASLNWSGLSAEAIGAMDTALSKALNTLDRDLASRCGKLAGER